MTDLLGLEQPEPKRTNDKPEAVALLEVLKSKRNRIHRYRERHPRIDYYPAADVLAILLHHSAITGEPCLAGVLDGLIRVAHRAVSPVSGNSGKK